MNVRESTHFEEYLFSKEIEMETSSYFKVPDLSPTPIRGFLKELVSNKAGLKEKDRELY